MKTKIEPVVIWLYVVFVVMVVFEAALIHGIEYACRQWGHNYGGAWVAWALFMAGGYIIAAPALNGVNKAKPQDPLVRFSVWLVPRWKGLGYIVNATFVGGAIGTAIALKKLDREIGQETLTILAAILFASFWVPFITNIWR